MNRYSNIVWDWNGTLLDDTWLSVDVMNAMLKRRRMPEIDVVRYRELFDFPVANYYRSLGFDFSLDSFESLVSEYCDEYDTRVYHCSLHVHVESVLDSLAHGISTHSLLSSTEHAALTHFVSCFGLTARFQEIIGQSNSHAQGKIETAEMMMQRSSHSAKSTLMVGDTLHDAEVARCLGIDCALIANGHQSRNRLITSDCQVFDSLEQFQKWFQQL